MSVRSSMVEAVGTVETDGCLLSGTAVSSQTPGSANYGIPGHLEIGKGPVWFSAGQMHGTRRLSDAWTLSGTDRSRSVKTTPTREAYCSVTADMTRADTTPLKAEFER